MHADVIDNLFTFNTQIIEFIPFRIISVAESQKLAPANPEIANQQIKLCQAISRYRA